MIQLVLIRHANAAPAAFGASDHERALDAKGRRDAPDVARRVLASGVRTALVLTSTARRARETATAFADAFDAEVRADDALYIADADDLLQAARESGADEIALVGHDPAMSELATRLAGREVRMATCTAAVFTWAGADDAAPEVAITAPR